MNNKALKQGNIHLKNTGNRISQKQWSYMAKSDSQLFDNHSCLLSAKEVSRLLGVAEKSVYRWAKDYRIPCINIGRCVRFRPEDIEAIRSGMRGLS
ncbi:MAG: helix-turn-helix domain-containing protein [Proteobacteria bacterium]|nr:helix-turn-helix domain-containing protein [Pseudomonadota bacterium]